jgi:hypothetical protein
MSLKVTSNYEYICDRCGSKDVIRQFGPDESSFDLIRRIHKSWFSGLVYDTVLCEICKGEYDKWMKAGAQ